MEGKILVTGGNGYVGSATILQALREGYHVVGTVRSSAKADLVASTKGFAPYATEGKLEFAIIADLNDANALANAMKGCIGAIHTASPVPYDGLKDFLEVAVLKAADSTPSVKRIVLSSSAVALFPVGTTADESVEIPLDAAQILPNLPPNLPAGLPTFSYYIASKVAARNEVVQHIKNQRPHWSAVELLPGSIMGRNPFARTKADVFTNSNVFTKFPIEDPTVVGPQSLYSAERNKRVALAGIAVHIDDCAIAHVSALRVAVNEFDSFLLLSDAPRGPDWDEALEVLRDSFPQVKISSGATQPTMHVRFDNSRSETELLHHPFVPYKKMIEDIYTQWLELPDTTG